MKSTYCNINKNFFLGIRGKDRESDEVAQNIANGRAQLHSSGVLFYFLEGSSSITMFVLYVVNYII